MADSNNLIYRWQSMDTCPLGAKVQLKTQLGVAVYGAVSNSTKHHYVEWAPMPAPAIDAD